MIRSWNTYDTPQELELLKQRAKDGEQVYIRYENKTILLSGETDENGKHTSRKVNRKEVEDMHTTFRFEADETTTETENSPKETSPDVTTGSTEHETTISCGRYLELKSEIEDIKETIKPLYEPILRKL